MTDKWQNFVQIHDILRLFITFNFIYVIKACRKYKLFAVQHQTNHINFLAH